MKQFRKFAMVASLLVLSVFLVACQDDASTSDEDVIRIGVLAPLTGSAAQFGNAVYNGIMLYVEEFNARGGLQIEIISFDEEGDPALGLTGYHSLYDQGVAAIIGSVTSGVTMAIVPEAYLDHMPMISASATHLGVTYNAETGQVFTNMFRTAYIDPYQGYKLANFAFQEMGAATAGVLFNTGDDYSTGLTQAFVEQAEVLGLEIVAIEGFSTGAVEFQSQLTNIAAANPDVLFLPVYYEDVALIAGQAASAGVQSTLIGGDGWNSVLTIIADPSLLEGAFYASGYSNDYPSERVQAFLAAYRAKYNADPNMFSAQAYDAAMVLFAALVEVDDLGFERASVEHRLAIIDALAATDIEAVTGSITFDEFNNPQKQLLILEIQEGVSTFWGPF
ncbi:MAG: ABC transporter substrate-binding protein [Defluviitaleaceae bacterium]|nr:ABC transporter substrate-binding protein [Defluviitaleaceae bacterium]